MQLMWKLAAIVQDPNIQVEINPQAEGGGPAWYATWWIWVLVALFIIVIVAITSRGRASE